MARTGRPRTVAPHSDTVRVTVDVPVDVLAHIDALAQQYGGSRSATVRRLLDDALAAIQPAGSPPPADPNP